VLGGTDFPGKQALPTLGKKEVPQVPRETWRWRASTGLTWAALPHTPMPCHHATPNGRLGRDRLKHLHGPFK